MSQMSTAQARAEQEECAALCLACAERCEACAGGYRSGVRALPAADMELLWRCARLCRVAAHLLLCRSSWAACVTARCAQLCEELSETFTQTSRSRCALAREACQHCAAACDIAAGLSLRSLAA